MQRLVEDLISLSRIEAEKFRLPDQAVDFAQLVEDTRDELADAAGIAGMIWSRRSIRTSPRCRGIGCSCRRCSTT